MLNFETLRRIPTRPKTDEELAEYSRKRLEAGSSILEISNELNITQSTLSVKLREQGVFASKIYQELKANGNG